MDLRPTCTCFDDAAELLVRFSKTHKEKFEKGFFTLCHGIKKIQDLTFSHAWVEDWELCYEVKLLEGERVILEMPKAFFHQAVLKCTRYSVREAVANDIKFGFCGPWEAEYKALCNDTSIKKIVIDTRSMNLVEKV